MYSEIIFKITDSISNLQFGFLIYNWSTLQVATVTLFCQRGLYLHVAPKLIPFILIPIRHLILYLISDFWLNCDLQGAGISGWLWSDQSQREIPAPCRSQFNQKSVIGYIILILIRQMPVFVVVNYQISNLLLCCLVFCKTVYIPGLLLVLIHVNDVLFHINIHSALVIFVDDTEYYGPVNLQHDTDLLIDWSSRFFPCFNHTQCRHVSFRADRIAS